MKITELTLCNFRCFGNEPKSINFTNFTTLIGANGAGKTAILQALVRLFGSHPSDRRLTKSDFHTPPSAPSNSITHVSLQIKAKIEFAHYTAENPTGVPQCFQQMIVSEPGGDPYCYVCLDGSWEQSLQNEGEIDEQISWIKIEEGKEDIKVPMKNHERAYIKVIYVPATRDPAAQLRQASGSLLYPILQAIPWPESVMQESQDSAERIRNSIKSVPGMQKLEETIASEWQRLQDFPLLQEVLLQPINPNFSALIKDVDAFFKKCDNDNLHSVDRLSDGLRSLFYFALLGTRFEIEHQSIQAITLGQSYPFDFELENFPILSIFAVEEPENHLAPHYLTHIVGLLGRIAGYERTQVLLTSQSIAILGRIDPVSIRHIRYDNKNCTVNIRKLHLPDEMDGEAFKYIKEAIKSYPELYFAKAVVLGEGDSEAVVLPRIARALDASLEEQFISFVPLGGRHVNHFWKLLNNLEIPHITLLDLDKDRQGGYWGRIKYAVNQLTLYRTDFNCTDLGLSQLELNELHLKSIDEDASAYITQLEENNVFFCSPLDLDFLLLRAFPTAYQQPTEGGSGPRAAGTPNRIEDARKAVLKQEGGDGHTYSAEEKEAFVWYQYLFLGRGKPVTHIVSLNRLTDEEIKLSVPPVLKNLLTKVKNLAAPTP